MALLLRDRDATSEVATGPPGGGPPVVAPDFACEACGAAMLAGQDWCLECGTAAPGRLGARPGWRAAFTVVALTLLLVVGAVVASYAALTTDAERQRLRPRRPATAARSPRPGRRAVPPRTPGAPRSSPAHRPRHDAAGRRHHPPAAGPARRRAVTIIPVAAARRHRARRPGRAARRAPRRRAATTPPPAAPRRRRPRRRRRPPASAAARQVRQGLRLDVRPGQARGRGVRPGRYAVDKSMKTVWDVVVPADGKPIAAGLMLDLGKPYALRAIEIATPTEGFTVELYGAVCNKETPEDILDKRWEHLTDIKDATDGKLVSLLKKSENKQQLLLLYITSRASRPIRASPSRT